MASDKKDVTLKVESVSYTLHEKKGAFRSMKVTYHCGVNNIPEWVCIEHQGFAKTRADHWVRIRGGEACNNVDDLLRQEHTLKVPTYIVVDKSNKFPVIKDYQDFKLKSYNNVTVKCNPS
jgi:DNA repair protein RadD